MKIDPRSHSPIYLQIAEAVRSAIAAELYRAGESLPSLRTLALELHVNPNTVQRAYDELEREGLVYSQRGKGLFVTEEGTSSAQTHVERVVRAKLDETIAAAAVAGMTTQQIRAVFEAAIKSLAPVKGQRE